MICTVCFRDELSKNSGGGCESAVIPFTTVLLRLSTNPPFSSEKIRPWCPKNPQRLLHARTDQDPPVQVPRRQRPLAYHPRRAPDA